MKFLCLRHDAHGFPVPLRAGHPEVTEEVLLHVSPLPVPDERYRLSVKAGNSSIDGVILVIEMIPFLFEEITKEMRNKILHVRSFRMSRQKNAISRFRLLCRA